MADGRFGLALALVSSQQVASGVTDATIFTVPGPNARMLDALVSGHVLKP